ncbi:MAG: hypothetical protein CFE37_12960 [Alphaproteobacteria bacterium PA4]|nr:MAG: hypothetical protein CFE37_12960 [Alphaproteobacteria bacterium PA4]
MEAHLATVIIPDGLAWQPLMNAIGDQLLVGFGNFENLGQLEEALYIALERDGPTRIVHIGSLSLTSEQLASYLGVLTAVAEEAPLTVCFQATDDTLRSDSIACIGQMREPDFEIDGWCLEDGEAAHAAAHETFWIPDRCRREGLETGDFAKLIFRISVDNAERPVSVERMWVLVRERTTDGYLGVLDNEPDAISENDDFWRGTEFPFAAKHVIDIQDRDANTVKLAMKEPRRRWRN